VSAELSPVSAERARELARTGLQKFLGLNNEPGDPRWWSVLYTDYRRATPGWRGLQDAEVYAMQDLGLVRVSDILEGGRVRVSLTVEGRRERDLLGDELWKQGARRAGR